MNMDFKRIAIIGVGLIGGSFGLALKKSRLCEKIVGIGRNKENLIKAKERGIIDEYFTDASRGVIDADLILLSTPVGKFQRILERIRGNIKKGAIVTDVGSVKLEVVKGLEPLIPEGVSFVGTHPIAGRESSGIADASAEFFAGIRCIVTPTSNTDKNALGKIISLWEAIGSKISLMTPEEHDRVFAIVSHIPHVIAYTLINTIMDLDENILQHSGPSLKDMTRIALSPTELWRDICSYNRENIIKSLNHFISHITDIKALIEKSDWDALEKEFQKAQAGRKSLGCH
ncbi:MAG: prephenate dehydrogenase/arogenate dehydrogenase family protein [Nitrospirae bacterium]|nr:prephenate dehydrogenase/arogenate dehydrogenase family protein [Nitrospirota bacterium]